MSDRLVSSKACCACQREDNRKRYLESREKIKAATRAYRALNLQQTKEKKRAHRAAFADVMRDKDRARSMNPERKTKAIARLNAWNAANPERSKARVKAWEAANPGKVLAKAAKRRAAELRSMPKWADKEKIEKVYALAARFRSLGCDFHVDHVIPLQGRNVCGLHVHNNLEIIEASKNRSKSNQLQGA